MVRLDIVQPPCHLSGDTPLANRRRASQAGWISHRWLETPVYFKTGQVCTKKSGITECHLQKPCQSFSGWTVLVCEPCLASLPTI